MRKLDPLTERLHVVAKNATHALCNLAGGGSENITRVLIGDFEDYYADADACQRVIRKRIENAEHRAREAVRKLHETQEETAQRAEIDRLILMDTLDGIKAIFGSEGLEKVVAHAQAANHARERNAEIDALEVALNSDENRSENAE